MINSIQRQIVVLQDALCTQSESLQPNLELDLKCSQEMVKLCELVKETQGFLNADEAKRVYECLSQNKESFAQGLERLKYESFISRVFPYIWSPDPIVVIEKAQIELFTQCTRYVLDEWEVDAEPGENRIEAKKTLCKFLDAGSNRLTCSEFRLRLLPDVFYDKHFECLIKLDLSSNQLDVLPESISRLVALRKLDLMVNRLTILPDGMGRLVELRDLSLVINQLIMLPENIGSLTSLIQLTLGGNGLITLPKGIGQLVSLTYLDLMSNRLVEWPESIDGLTALEHLDLGDNQLIALPENIGRLTTVRKLNLRRNLTLTSLPNSILQLPRHCEIDVTGCGLSQAVLAQLQDVMSDPEYVGPSISYSIHERRNLVFETRTIEESLEDFFSITGRRPDLCHVYTNNIQKESLRVWLGRLCDIADYKSEGAKKQAIAHQVLNYLIRASSEDRFREVFYLTLQDATITCGDRVALSLVHLGLQYALDQNDPKNIQELIRLLIRGVFVIGLLEEIARQKIQTLFFFDEIEVYLGYLVKLKERLSIPINVEEMLYFQFSNITQIDLDLACDFVQDQLACKENLAQFLIGQEKWNKALNLEFPEEIADLETQKRVALEVSTPDYEAINKAFKDALIELTCRILTSVEL